MGDRGGVQRLTVRSGPAAVGVASAWLRELAATGGLDAEQAFRLDLCASELLANLAEHAGLAPGAEVQLEVVLEPGAAVLTVTDPGAPFDPRVARPSGGPASLASAAAGGFGLLLARRFSDQLGYRRLEGANQVTVRVGPGRGPLDAGTLEAIAATPLFRGVPARQLAALLAGCEVRSCAPGDVLLREGERHPHVLLTLEGRLEVHLDHPRSRFHIDLGPGELVGELSVADGQPGSAWVRAVEPGRLLLIPADVFLGPVLAVPTVVRNLVVLLSERVRRSNQQVVARLRATLELESLQRELEVARQMQASMLPSAPLFPGEPRLEARGFMRAARQVGGDFYDAFPLSEGRCFVALGDVCGKGTPAALYMVRTLTLLRSEALRTLKDADRQLARLAARTNDLLAGSNEAGQFVTLFCAIVDLERDRLHFVNGGHNPPVLRLPGAAPGFLSGPRNPLVGLIPGRTFAAGSVAFPPGSLLLMYTDGVTEAESPAGARLGEQALLSLLGAEPAPAADAAVEAVVAAVDAFATGQPQYDDLTLLALRRR